jgi:small subunit ribosomal protein S1
MVDRDLQTPHLGEDYWQALLEQGEWSRSEGVGGHWPEPPPESWQEPGAAGHGPGHLGRDGQASAREPFWTQLDDWLCSGTHFTAPVIGCNKGGLLVRVCESIGFVPASQLAELPTSLGTPGLRADLEAYVGRSLHLRLIELDPDRCRVICSERALNWGDDDLDLRLAALEDEIGSEVVGTVRSVCDFGAFIDLGGLDGLIHISELSWQRVSHPSTVLSVGNSVRVLVLSVDRDARRVALSLKRLVPDPWHLVGRHYEVGDVIDAVVTNVVDFGAFARVPEGIDGLIHISELADGPFFHPANVVSEGQHVKVRVLHVDVDGRRLGLSLRQA